MTILISTLSSFELFQDSLSSLKSFANTIYLQAIEHSYTSIGENPPEDIMQKISEEKEITLEEYKTELEEKKTKDPKLTDQIYSYAISGVGKTVKVTEKVGEGVVKVVGNTLQISIGLLSQLTYLIVAIIVLLIVFRKYV